MKRTFTTSTLVAFAAALAIIPATILVAQPGPGAPGFGGPHGRGFGPDGPGFFLEHMTEELELSEGQVAELEEMLSAHRVATAELRAQARSAHEEAAKLAESETFDEAAIRAAGRKVADVQVELAVERARLRSEMHAALTPEQQAKADELKAERQQRREWFKEREDGRRGRAPQARRW